MGIGRPGSLAVLIRSTVSVCAMRTTSPNADAPAVWSAWSWPYTRRVTLRPVTRRIAAGSASASEGGGSMTTTARR